MIVFNVYTYIRCESRRQSDIYLIFGNALAVGQNVDVGCLQPFSFRCGIAGRCPPLPVVALRPEA